MLFWLCSICISVAQTAEIDVDHESPQFGIGRIDASVLNKTLNNPLLCDVFEDLLAFTGLSESEVRARLMRTANHHFALEHRFRNPRSVGELTWYYRTSVAYLFANAIHPVPSIVIDQLQSPRNTEPVLCFAGGVGTNAVWLAEKGFAVHYFGIGMIEQQFALFRAQRRDTKKKIKFIEPYAGAIGTYARGFDAIESLPNSPTYATILAFDVFEHIPNYEIVAHRLGKTLLPGGRILINAPFNNDAESQFDIHLRQSVPISQALGSTIKFTSTDRNGYSTYEKIL